MHADEGTDQDDLGTLTRHGDLWTLVFTRRMAHPREKVWRAVTEPEHHRPARGATLERVP